MTLGGLVAAIGSAVDDAIGCRKRLPLFAGTNITQSPACFRRVFEGCQEVRDRYLEPIITVVVFSPSSRFLELKVVSSSLMGLGYLAAAGFEMLLSPTVTPALCAILLPWSSRNGNRGLPDSLRESISSLNSSLRRSTVILAIALASLVAMVVVPRLGVSFCQIRS